MKTKIFFYSLLVPLLLFLNLPLLVEGGEDDLLSKIKMIPIKGNKKTPDFSLQDINGKKVELKQFKGKVIFLNFWATWCTPCKEEMPCMEILYQQFKEKNFALLAISVDYGGLKPVKEYINRHHYTFPVLLDPKGRTLDLFGVKGIPTTYLIDKKGIMVAKAVGPRDWNSPEVVSLINLLIEKE